MNTLETKETLQIEKLFSRLVDYSFTNNEHRYIQETFLRMKLGEVSLRDASKIILEGMEKREWKKEPFLIKRAKTLLLKYSLSLPLNVSIGKITSSLQVGEWEIIKRVESRKDRKYWLCLCSCGNFREVSEHSLRNGRSKSCGCKGKDKEFQLIFPFNRKGGVKKWTTS